MVKALRAGDLAEARRHRVVEPGRRPRAGGARPASRAGAADLRRDTRLDFRCGVETGPKGGNGCAQLRRCALSWGRRRRPFSPTNAAIRTWWWTASSARRRARALADMAARRGTGKAAAGGGAGRNIGFGGWLRSSAGRDRDRCRGDHIGVAAWTAAVTAAAAALIHKREGTSHAMH